MRLIMIPFLICLSFVAPPAAIVCLPWASVLIYRFVRDYRTIKYSQAYLADEQKILEVARGLRTR